MLDSTREVLLSAGEKFLAVGWGMLSRFEMRGLLVSRNDVALIILYVLVCVLKMIRMACVH